MQLVVFNEATLFTAADAEAAVRACASQLALHVAPIWGRGPALVVYGEDRVAPSGADILTILDDPDQAQTLGYHRETLDGRPYLRVFARPIINHGGLPLEGNMSVSSVLSHEVCEWFTDRYLNLWADGPDGDYALEICDAVENDTYMIDGVSVSDFATPSYFDPHAPPEAQFDYLKRLDKPFSCTPTGYVQIRKNGVVQNQFGGRYADWKRASKDLPSSRAARRRSRGAAR